MFPCSKGHSTRAYLDNIQMTLEERPGGKMQGEGDPRKQTSRLQNVETFGVASAVQRNGIFVTGA